MIPSDGENFEKAAQYAKIKEAVIHKNSHPHVRELWLEKSLWLQMHQSKWPKRENSLIRNKESVNESSIIPSPEKDTEGCRQLLGEENEALTLPKYKKFSF